MPPAPVDWTAIGDALAADCPSLTLRGATAKVLTEVSKLGPTRDAKIEFARVYESLRWNEPDRVLNIVANLVLRASEPDSSLNIKADAWRYVITVLDEWIGQARIFYLVCGILESTLRSRLDARLTDVFGGDWLEAPDVPPSKLHELAPKHEQRDAQLANVRDLLATLVPGQVTVEQLRADLERALAPPPPDETPTGAQFLRRLTLGGLFMFFDKGTLWEGRAQLNELLMGRDGKGPKVRREDMQKVFRVLIDARNEVAHYRPDRFLRLDHAMFQAGRLARWLGQNLQRIYESIDTRHSTEPSIVFAPVAQNAGWTTRTDAHQCAEPGCVTPAPLDWILADAPTSLEDLPGMPMRRACLFHRVKWRQDEHH